MTYAKVNNGQIEEWPLSEWEIKQRFPNTSFTRPFVAPDGYMLVIETQPTTADINSYPSEIQPAFIDGVLSQQWELLPIPEDVKQESDAKKAYIVRIERNEKLAECDWTQLSDAPVSAAPWATYRQALRDITSQAGFPWEIIWPEEP